MSCARQRACARVKSGRIRSGVPTYKIKSRQLLRIHKFCFGTVLETGGTVCGRENAEANCMGRWAVFLNLETKSTFGLGILELHRPLVHGCIQSISLGIFGRACSPRMVPHKSEGRG